MLKYFLDAEDMPEVASNAVVFVDAVVQTLRLPSAAALPNPFIGVRDEGLFYAFFGANSVHLVFESEVSQQPPPPPAYAHMAAQARHWLPPPPSFHTQSSRPRTQSSISNAPLLRPLQGHTRCALAVFL